MKDENSIELLQKWYLVTIDDPELLTGKSLYNLTKIVLEVINFKFVTLDYIDGSGIKRGLIYSLQQQKDRVYTIEEFLQILLDANQFDFGDFFFFKEFPSKWDNSSEDLRYPDLISQTDTTIRAIDNQYMYIYTPHKTIISAIEKKYIIESITHDLRMGSGLTFGHFKN